MAEPFDPGEFDIPPSSDDPHTDYRTLLDAMRRAGVEGVADASAALARQIEQDAHQRADWGKTMGSEVRDLQRAAGTLHRVSTAMWWDRLKEWLWAALIALAVIFAAALAYRWAKEPVIEQHLYGCAGRWNAKTHTCKGGWVPLQAQQGP